MREPIQYTGNRITSETRNYGMQEINYHEMAQYIIVSRWKLQPTMLITL